MKGCDLTVYCPWLPFVWMCEVWRMFCVCLTFVWCLYVCNAKERSSFSFTVWDDKNENENENELVKFVLVLVQPYGTALVFGGRVEVSSVLRLWLWLWLWLSG